MLLRCYVVSVRFFSLVFLICFLLDNGSIFELFSESVLYQMCSAVKRPLMKYLRVVFFVLAFVFFAFTSIRMVAVYSGKISHVIWKPLLVCERPLYDLGEIKKGESRSHDFVIENKGTSDLKIISVTPGCSSCIKVVEFTKHPIASGRTGLVRLTFLSELLNKGETSKAAVIKSNDPNRSVFLLTFKATIQEDTEKKPE
jgi:hypothetical protein